MSRDELPARIVKKCIAEVLANCAGRLDADLEKIGLTRGEFYLAFP
jgi:hypothetical protein